MTITGQVINSSVEQRDLVGKDGIKNRRSISHVLVMSGDPKKGGVEILNVRSFEEGFKLPAIGEQVTLGPIKKYECYDGQVAEVLV